MPHSIDNPNVSPDSKSHRSHTWLHDQLQFIWNEHFGDVERLNTVTITWGRTNRGRLGSITAKGGTPNHPERSEIRINSLLRDSAVPEAVIWQTIAHELAHYTHGFCSPHPRKYTHPHRGNVVDLELQKRGLGDVHTQSEIWLKANWHNYVTTTIGPKSKRQRSSYVRTNLSFLSHLSQITRSRRRLGK